MGAWGGGRGTNLIDGGAPFYDTYETADGRHVAIGPVEPKFFAILIEKMGLAAGDLPSQNDRKAWPELRLRLAEAFRARTQAEWCRASAPRSARSGCSAAGRCGRSEEHTYELQSLMRISYAVLCL